MTLMDQTFLLYQWRSGYRFFLQEILKQKNGMGREVGGRVRMGNTCAPMADSCECMAKTTTIL